MAYYACLTYYRAVMEMLGADSSAGYNFGDPRVYVFSDVTSKFSATATSFSSSGVPRAYKLAASGDFSTPSAGVSTLSGAALTLSDSASLDVTWGCVFTQYNNPLIVFDASDSSGDGDATISDATIVDNTTTVDDLRIEIPVTYGGLSLSQDVRDDILTNILMNTGEPGSLPGEGGSHDPVFTIYSGPVPADADTAVTGSNSVLYSEGPAIGGKYFWSYSTVTERLIIATSDSFLSSTTCTATDTGTATFFRLANTTSETGKVIQGTISDSSGTGTMILDTTSLVNSSDFTIEECTIYFDGI